MLALHSGICPSGPYHSKILDVFLQHRFGLCAATISELAILQEHERDPEAQIGVRKFKITGVDCMRGAAHSQNTRYLKEDKTFGEMEIVSLTPNKQTKKKKTATRSL